MITAELLSRDGNGAVELDDVLARPIMVMLAGPIKVWWSEWNSEAHEAYSAWRAEVRQACADAGFLVYSPHLAWHGVWEEAAQAVNDTAIEVADVMIDLTPPGTRADGTKKELEHARRVGTPVVAAPPGTDLDWLVHRIILSADVSWTL